MHASRAFAMALLVAATSLALPGFADTEPVPTVVLAEILADPDTTLGEREFVELWNAGQATVQLGGWKLRDAPTTSGSMNTYTFPTWSLPPGGRVVVWGGGTPDSRGPAWSNPSVWNNAGDAATLLDSLGNVVDWLGYGSISSPVPENQTVQAKPARGQSLQLDGDTWVLASPTPGTALGATGGGLTIEVANVAPGAALADLPRWVRPGSHASFTVLATDPNGAQDVSGWSLRSAGNLLASGTAGGSHPVTVPAPRTGTSWDLELQVTDQGGLLTTAQAVLPLRFSDLLVLMPNNGPLPFPAAAPGTGELHAAGPVTIRNLGDGPLVPRIDVSTFSGPASFPAEGHLWLGWPGQEGTVWTEYAGPFTPLPEIEAGAELEVSLRLRNLPTPLPAGAYGTTFTVVTA